MGTLSSESFFSDVYGDLFKRTGMAAVPYAISLGYKPIGEEDDFHFPKEGETYLTPDGTIAKKEKGDKGPYGPRLIVVRFKKRVLVFDFDEVANATRVLAKEARPGTYQWLRAVSLCGETVEIEGIVEEREV